MESNEPCIWVNGMQVIARKSAFYNALDGWCLVCCETYACNALEKDRCVHCKRELCHRIKTINEAQ